MGVHHRFDREDLARLNGRVDERPVPWPRGTKHGSNVMNPSTQAMASRMREFLESGALDDRPGGAIYRESRRMRLKSQDGGFLRRECHSPHRLQIIRSRGFTITKDVARSLNVRAKQLTYP